MAGESCKLTEKEVHKDRLHDDIQERNLLFHKSKNKKRDKIIELEQKQVQRQKDGEDFIVSTTIEKKILKTRVEDEEQQSGLGRRLDEEWSGLEHSLTKKGKP